MKRVKIKKDFKIVDYFRQFSIVVAGIVVTFLGSGLISRCSTQQEIKSVMHLVIKELEQNKTKMEQAKARIANEEIIATYLNKCNYDYEQIPGDTLEKYSSFITSSTSFEYTTDALEVLKNSSLAQAISDKEIILNIIQSYDALRIVKENIKDFFDIKVGIISPIFLNRSEKEFEKIAKSASSGIQLKYALCLGDQRMRNFCKMTPGFFDRDLFSKRINQLNHTILTLKKNYR